MRAHIEMITTGSGQIFTGSIPLVYGGTGVTTSLRVQGLAYYYRLGPGPNFRTRPITNYLSRPVEKNVSQHTFVVFDVEVALTGIFSFIVLHVAGQFTSSCTGGHIAM